MGSSKPFIGWVRGQASRGRGATSRIWAVNEKMFSQLERPFELGCPTAGYGRSCRALALGTSPSGRPASMQPFPDFSIRRSVVCCVSSSLSGDQDAADRKAAAPLRAYAAQRTPSAKQESLFPGSISMMPPAPAGPVSISDIAAPVAQEMKQLQLNLKSVIGDRHPMLMAAAEQIFGAGGKRLRPLIVFLVGKATVELGGVRQVLQQLPLSCFWVARCWRQPCYPLAGT